MDPQACLDILARAAQEHSRNGGDECGCGVPGQRQAGRFGPARAAAPAAPGAGGAGEAVEAPGAAPPAASGGASGGPPPPPPPPAASRRGAALAAAAEARGAGQLLDLGTGKNETLEGDMSEAAVLERFPELRAAGARDAAPAPAAQGAQEADQNARTEPRLPSEAVVAALRLHEIRVAVHRAFDGAFQHLLLGTGGGAKAVARTYPFVVACATKRFQALSSEVQAAAAELEAAASGDGAGAEEASEAARLLRKVQGLEKARLQAVAAQHVEQSQRLGAAADGAEAEQLRRARHQLGPIGEEIEDMVSELRHTAAELRALEQGA